MSAPYIPLYIDDFDGATSHLSLEEEAAYMRLLKLCWRSPGCSIPMDTAWIARKIRLSPDDFERVARPVLLEFFTTLRGRWTQRRLKKEWTKYAVTKRERSEAGRKGGLAKSRNRKENEASKASVLLYQPKPEPEPTTFPSQERKNLSGSSTPDAPFPVILGGRS